MKLKEACSLEKSYDKCIKKQRCYFAIKRPSSQSYVFSSMEKRYVRLWMWELDHKKGWMPKNWCFWTVVMEKIIESPLDCKEIKPVNPKGNQSWIFIRRSDAEAEAPIFWPPDVKSWLIRKDSDAGKDWRQEEKGTIEDEMAEWYHWFNGPEFEQILGVGDGQGNLQCCSPWGHIESDTTEQLNSNNNVHLHLWKFTTWFVCRGLIVMNTKPLLLGEIQHWLSVSSWSHFH